jgi:small subunit ribosomal protein S1
MTEINDNVNVESQKTEEVQNHEIKNEANTETVVAEEKAKPEIKPIENFNWDLIGKKDDAYSKEERAKLEELYNNTFKLIEEGEVVMGTVVAINKREVVVNIGYKSEGIINANEFRTETEIKVGDKVEVFVENMESIDGQLILSHKKAKSLKSWDRVNEAHDNDEIVKGYIKCKTKGGMIVDVFGLEAFLPGSQIDVKPIRDYDVYVGKTMEFKVVKINEEFKNVVVSHKALIEAELEEQKKEIVAKLEKGQVLEGIVKNITSYGVFIDLGGVDGLIHITDLSWGRVTHPEEIVSLDSKIQVVILDFDEDKKRIALGLKQLTPHPWDALDANLKVGDKVSGKVVVLADYGAFIEIAPGVEGLIHVSEMSWSQHLRSAQEFMKVGDDIEAVILTLDREERKMSLGIKQLHPDPWENIETKFNIGTKQTAKVRNFTNFGIFVELEEGVDGLVHISDLSWTKKIKHPAEFTTIGAELEVVVLEIDKENRRLSLGHKQIEENPWEVFETIFTIDSIHEGTIVEMSDKGSIIALPYGVEGFSTPKHLIKEDGSSAKIEEKLDFKVIEFNKDSKKIFVSHSRIYEDLNKEKEAESKKAKGEKTTKRTKAQIENKIEKTTLGDVTDLAAIKEELLEKEKKTKK